MFDMDGSEIHLKDCLAATTATNKNERKLFLGKVFVERQTCEIASAKCDHKSNSPYPEFTQCEMQQRRHV